MQEDMRTLLEKDLKAFRHMNIEGRRLDEAIVIGPRDLKILSGETCFDKNYAFAIVTAAVEDAPYDANWSYQIGGDARRDVEGDAAWWALPAWVQHNKVADLPLDADPVLAALARVERRLGALEDLVRSRAVERVDMRRLSTPALLPRNHVLRISVWQGAERTPVPGAKVTLRGWKLQVPVGSGGW